MGIKKIAGLLGILLLVFTLGIGNFVYAESGGSLTAEEYLQSAQPANQIDSQTPMASPANPSIQSNSQTGTNNATIPNSNVSPQNNGVNEAITNINSGKALEIKPIPLSDAVSFVKGKMGQVYYAMREFSLPYAAVVLALAGLVMMMPFKPQLKQYMGFSILGAGLVGFLFIHFGPIILGVFQGFVK